MNNIVELTGVPASGKSTFVRSENLSVLDNTALFPLLYKFPKMFAFLLAEAYLLCLGLKCFPFRKLNVFTRMVLREEVGFLYKANIFRNTLRKFAIYFMINENDFPGVYVDEGISHIPFNFLSSDFEVVVSLIEPYLKNISVSYIECTSNKELKKRLLKRGHGRLEFIEIDMLIKQNREIEKKMLKKYPSKCLTFKVEINA